MNEKCNSFQDKVGAIIFARMDSKRLNGKALVNIMGQPLLDHILARVRGICSEMPVVLATTNRKIDIPLVRWAQKKQITVYYGPLKNVLLRAIYCAEEFGFSGFVRVCADRPFLDPKINARLIEIYHATNSDLATNALTKSFPTGAMAEVIRLSALKGIMAQNPEPEDLEHLTRYIYRNPQDFRIENMCSDDPTLSHISLAIDTVADLQRTRWMFEQMSNPQAASFQEVIGLARAWTQKQEWCP